MTTDVRRKIALLTAQALALGLTLAWVTIPANTIFLEQFGSGLLPVTYIGAAAAGALSSVLLSRSLRRRTISAVAVRLFAGTSAGLTVAWIVLSQGASWMSFLLLVVLPVALPVGFMFVVGQAGLLLDVRVLKTLYPRVVAGFALGFAVGGLVGAPLMSLLGGTEHLLAAAAVASAIMLALTLATLRSFGPELSVLEVEDESAGGTSIKSLLSNRYVVLITAFQTLSAIESQWLDFQVYDHAARRYPNGDDLAAFVGQFSAIAYGADILFLLLGAGLLMRRFGLRFGLRANSMVVFAMVLALIVASIAQGSGAALVFFLVVACRASDITLSDGASRTSLSAAYQAVPNAQRPAAQTLVESLAVPLAIGFSGVVLVVLGTTVGTAGLWLPVLTLVVLAAWVACSIVLYVEYGRNLLTNLRHRLLEPSGLDDGSGFADDVVDKLVDSADPRDVRLGITALMSSQRPDRAERLESIAGTGAAGLQETVLRQLAEIDRDRAVAVAHNGLADDRPAVRTAALSLLADLGNAHDATAAFQLLSDESDDVRLAAVRAVSALGDAAMRSSLDGLLAELAGSDRVADRRLAAAMLRVCSTESGLDRQLLGRLLRDPESTVALDALGAVRWSDDTAWSSAVVDLLDRRDTAAGAIEALARGGEASLVLCDVALADRGTGTVAARRSVQWTRVCGQMGGPDAGSILHRHADHNDREVGLAIIRALAALEGEPGDARRSALATELLATDLDHAALLLGRAVALADLPEASTVRSALSDELDLIRDRVVAILSLRLGVDAGNRVDFQLRQPSPRVHALALEWLDIELAGSDRRALPFLDPGLADVDRYTALMTDRDATLDDRALIIRDLVEDRDAVWRRPWLSACAMLTASRLEVVDIRQFDVSGHELVVDQPSILHETHRQLTTQGPAQ